MLSNLFSSLKINSVVIKNRLMVPAMVTNLCTDEGMATEAFIAYHETKAHGGWGLILTENYAIAPEGRGYRNVPGLWSEEQAASHQALTERVHKYEGVVLFAQIYHCGRQTRHDLNGGYQPVSASPIPCPFCKEIPKELSQSEIEDIIVKFSRAAKRAKDIGFDGIEIHGGHGYLIAQFMSAYSNKRTDRYGGNLINRMRFPLEVIEVIRKEVGNDFPICFRISADEKLPGSRSIEETMIIAEILEKHGVDALNVSVGAYGTPVVVAPMQYPQGWIVEYAEKIKRAVNIPVITVNRIVDPLMADQIIRLGRADIVAMGRASLADPDLPRKAMAGKLDEIRNCIGCIVCDASLVRDTQIRCSVNPTLAYESEGQPVAAAKPKKVVVIGGGPAGLEVSRVAAARGHNVLLYEKSDRLGGDFAVAAFPPYKGGLASFISWQRAQCEKSGVEIILNTEVTPDLIKENLADILIVATGAEPLIPDIPGIRLSHVKYAKDVLLGTDTNERIVVLGGGSVGVETACFLGMQGKNLSVVEVREGFSLEEDARIREQNYKLMNELGIKQFPNTKAVEITTTGIILETRGQRFFKRADTVVLATGYRSDDTLFKELKGLCSEIHKAGNTECVGNLIEAVRSGYCLGASI